VHRKAGVAFTSLSLQVPAFHESYSLNHPVLRNLCGYGASPSQNAVEYAEICAEWSNNQIEWAERGDMICQIQHSAYPYLISFSSSRLSKMIRHGCEMFDVVVEVESSIKRWSSYSSTRQTKAKMTREELLSGDWADGGFSEDEAEGFDDESIPGQDIVDPPSDRNGVNVLSAKIKSKAPESETSPQVKIPLEDITDISALALGVLVHLRLSVEQPGSKRGNVIRSYKGVTGAKLAILRSLSSSACRSYQLFLTKTLPVLHQCFCLPTWCQVPLEVQSRCFRSNFADYEAHIKTFLIWILVVALWPHLTKWLDSTRYLDAPSPGYRFGATPDLVDCIGFPRTRVDASNKEERLDAATEGVIVAAHTPANAGGDTVTEPFKPEEWQDFRVGEASFQVLVGNPTWFYYVQLKKPQQGSSKCSLSKNMMRASHLVEVVEDWALDDTNEWRVRRHREARKLKRHWSNYDVYEEHSNDAAFRQ